METNALPHGRPMAAIRKLDPALVNKIAAGEVIERPASVVKELVENALDAGATRIDVVLEVGGTKLIRVSDNGCGIARDDLPLALAPHATSKIYSDDDLFNIRSLGFRGEALASIASVSRLRLVSRPEDQLEAYELSMGNDHDATLQPCAAAPGTTVEIRHLFYNVPARRKFLRQPQTECSHATEQIARLALAHPQVAFTLTHNGRSLRNLPATEDRRTRIADFYGAELAECLLDIDRNERGLGIAALIAPPAQSRASTKWQYLFLNGRYITDRRLGYAVREAFRGLVEHDRFPVVFIFLTTDPREFDANVHPTKIEVRWRDAGLVQSQVLSALREMLLSHDLTPAFRVNSGSPRGSFPRQTDPAAQQRARQALADYLKRVDPTQTRLGFQPPPFATENLRPSIAGTLKAPTLDRRNELTDKSESQLAERDAPPSSQVEGIETKAERESFISDPKSQISDLKSQISDFNAQIPESETSTNLETPISDFASRGAPASVMQVHNTYLVAQTETGVIIVDQHALHERILYEGFRERVLAGPLESQGLLIPETIEVSAEQTETAERHASLFRQLGIELSAFGPTTLAVQGFPSLLHNVDIKTFVADLLDKLAESDAGESEETLIHAALDMMACKAAVKAGDALTTEEIYALLEQRHLTDRASNCPHGRPTTLELTTRDLEKQFKRI